MSGVSKWCCHFGVCFFFFKQKTAYEIKECDWSSDVWLFRSHTFSLYIHVGFRTKERARVLPISDCSNIRRWNGLIRLQRVWECPVVGWAVLFWPGFALQGVREFTSSRAWAQMGEPASGGTSRALPPGDG